MQFHIVLILSATVVVIIFLKVKFGLFTVIKFSFFVMLLVRLLEEIRIGSELHDVFH